MPKSTSTPVLRNASLADFLTPVQKQNKNRRKNKKSPSPAVLQEEETPKSLKAIPESAAVSQSPLDSSTQSQYEISSPQLNVIPEGLSLDSSALSRDSFSSIGESPQIWSTIPQSARLNSSACSSSFLSSDGGGDVDIDEQEFEKTIEKCRNVSLLEMPKTPEKNERDEKAPSLVKPNPELVNNTSLLDKLILLYFSPILVKVNQADTDFKSNLRDKGFDLHFQLTHPLFDFLHFI